MKKIVFAFSLIIAVVMTACTPETLNERLGIPEDAILLSSERFSGHGTKTSVSDISVKWVNEDKVYLNGSEYSVTVDNSGNAYVNASDEIRNSEVYGYYGVSGTPTWNSSEKKLTVTVPSEYISSYGGGRQVIALPMVAYKSGAANKIEFKHVTAAVKVRVKNTTNYVLELDKVVVSSSTLQLSGTRDVTLNTCVVSDQSGEISTDDKSVTVNFETNTFVNPYGDDDNNIKEVQVPILPVGSGSLTIQIYAHVAGTPAKANTYVYDHTESGAAIGRNIMITAGVNLGGSYTTASLKGLFSVSSSKKVFFSKGNLRWSYNNGATHATSDGTASGTWSFATNQYDIIGSSAGNTTAEANRSSENNPIDLFGWGTSGWNNGNQYYMPYNSATSSGKYGPKSGTSYYGLTGDYSKSDWGVYNAISNGGNAVGLWRTLADDEWKYLFEDRTDASNKYGCAIVNGTAGVIILPDVFSDPMKNGGSSAFVPASSSIDFASNNYSVANWASMETAGALFLPFAGYRNGTTVTNNPYTNIYGANLCYWSSTYKGSGNAYHLYFNMSTYGTGRGVKTHAYYNGVPYGQAVRLVQDEN